MPKTKDQVTVEFDHHWPIPEVDPDEAVAELQRSSPVAWTNAHGGYWVVTRYEDVDRVLRDYRVFSSRDGMAIPAHPMEYGIPVNLDPPEHSPYRRAMNPHMSREAVERLLPRIARWTAYYIDQVIESGECDMADDLAVPIPGAVTLEWVGWEQREEWERISTAFHDHLSRPLDHPKTQQSHRDLEWFGERVKEELERRRREPKDDAITIVAQLEIDGEPISPERAAAMVTIWVAGGVDTATTSILAALEHLDRVPEDRRRLIEEPGLWDSAVEELLRRYPPTRSTARTARADVELGGCLIEKGDRVLASLCAANADPDVFDRPLEVILDREPTRYLTFGMGAHRCVGMFLAKEEVKLVLSEVLRRMPDYRLVRERIEPYLRQSEMRGWISAPAVFTPGERSDSSCRTPSGANLSAAL